jgi:hypothetical protein
MKPFLSLLLYLQTWATALFWFSMIGVLLLAVTLIFTFVSLISGVGEVKDLAFSVSKYAYAALALPYLFVWYPFRQLLANKRLALLPYFHLRLGLLMLFLTTLVAIYLPVSSSLLAPGAVNWNIAIRIFFVCSVGVWLFQRLSTSAAITPVLQIVSPITTILLLRHCSYDISVPSIPWAPGLDMILLLLSLLAWITALRALAAHGVYAPPAMDIFNTNKSPGMNFGTNWPLFLVKMQQQPRSREGTLLRGYPDTWSNRVRLFGGSMIFCALIAIPMSWLFEGIGSYANVLTNAQQFLSICCCLTLVYLNSDLVARSRLLWLRHGGDRREHWRFVEQTLLSDFALTAILLTLVSLLSVFTATPAEQSLQKLLFPTFAFSLAFLSMAYCMLACRAGRDNVWLLLVLFALTLAIFTSDIISDSFTPDPPPSISMQLLKILSASLPFLVTILLFRALAKYYFLRIDWNQVQPLRNALRT